jgi:uncharacterized protein (DUF2345 family)
MEKLKSTPRNYAEALEVLAGRESVRLGNNTYLVRLNGDQQIAVRLHSTYIVRFYQTGRITLHTGGYYTVTTKDRINQFISGKVYQKAHQWYLVRNRGELGLDWDNPRDFADGMEA